MAIIFQPRSSSATTGIVIVMASQGLMSLAAGITGYLLLRLAATRAPRPTPSR